MMVMLPLNVDLLTEEKDLTFFVKKVRSKNFYYLS